MSADSNVNWKVQLRHALMDHFDESELRGLSFDLDIEYENISRDSKSDTVIQLIEHCIRTDRIEELIALCSQQRPNIPWTDIDKAARIWSRKRSKQNFVLDTWRYLDSDHRKNNNRVYFAIVIVILLPLAFVIVWFTMNSNLSGNQGVSESIVIDPETTPIPPTATPIPPTATPIPSTATPILPTATSIFAGISTNGLIKLFSEDFSSNLNLWPLGSRQFTNVDMTTAIESQSFRKTLTAVNEAPWYNWSPKVPNVSAKDFFYVMDATLIDTTNINATSLLLAFRVSQDNSDLYVVIIGARGYSIREFTNNSVREIVGWTQSDLIQFRTGIKNIYSILANGSNITVFVNGRELLSFVDSTHSSFGQFGFGLHIETLGETATFEFDNLTIYEAP